MTSIELLRRSMGLSQKAAAEQAGVPYQRYVEIENAYRRAWPGEREKLAAFYGVTEAVLFDDRGMAVEVRPELVRQALAVSGRC